MSRSVRRRRPDYNNGDDDEDDDIGFRGRPHPSLRPLGKLPVRPDTLQINSWQWLFVFLLILFTVWLTFFAHSYVPPPNNDLEDPRLFSEARARIFLERLTDIGSKPSGSDALEIEAFGAVVTEIERIKSVAKSVHHLELDIQRPSGCYNMMRFDQFTLCYKKVLNVVLRFGASAQPSKHSLLVNCHFDTWPDSPGASDDCVSCAIMMEIVYLLSQTDEALDHDVIFLFNGAEENVLNAGHGFITTHPWRHSIRAFFNLEAAGSGGREMLFQAGPGNQWLLKTYLKAAPRPHCSVMGQDTFQAGLIPGVTDFIMFTEHGKLSGLDVAYVRNGYVYHTEFDVPRMITNGSIQRAGENTFETIKAIVASPYLAHPGEAGTEQYVFFDVLGLFVVVYSYEVGLYINYLVMALVAARVIYNIAMHQSFYYSYGQLLTSIAVQYGVWLCMVLTMLFCSFVVQFIDGALCWYATPFLVIPVYCIPMSITSITLHHIYARYASKKFVNNAVQETCSFDAQLCVNCCTLFTVNSMGLASAFFWMITTVAPLSRVALNTVLRRLTGENLSSRLLFLSNMICCFPACLFVVYFIGVTMDIFIPIMGRSLAINSELPIGGMAFLGTIGVGLCFHSLIYITPARTIRRVQIALVSITVLTYVLIAVKVIGKPYHYDEQWPRLRRMHLQHVHRRVQSPDGQQLSNDSGILYVPLDHRGYADLPPITGLNTCQHPTNCTKERGRYCDLPYFIAVASLIPPEYFCWKPSTDDQANGWAPARLTLISDEKKPDGRVDLQFTLQGSDHMALQVTPQAGWILDSWSLDAPIIHKQITSFIFLAQGESTESGVNDWEVTITLKPHPTDAPGANRAHIGLSSFFLHGPHQRSAKLTDYLQMIHENRPNGDWRWAMTASTWSNEQIAVTY